MSSRSLAEGRRLGVALLGSTGSIGRQAVEVLEQHADRFRVVALATGRNRSELEAQAARLHPAAAALADEAEELELPPGTVRERGSDALEILATRDDVDIVVIARGTPGFSGADLANLVNEAALLAARRGKRHVAMAEFELAKDKVLMGLERRSLVMSEREKKTTAYHEAGHALVTHYTVGSDPLHKVTIVPRGRSLGLTMSLPERDSYGFTKKELEGKVDVMLGGRMAEELVFGKDQTTTGAADDIRRATELARKMVTEFGFSDKLGPLYYQDGEEAGALAPLIAQLRDISPDTARIIDEEVRKIIAESKARVQQILFEHLPNLHTIAKALLANETLTGADVRALLSGAAMVPFEQSLKKSVSTHVGQV